MGGDLSHHAGEIRPSPSLRIPDDLKTHLGETLPSSLHCCFNGAMFRQLHARNNRKPGDAFFDAILAEDPAAAASTIDGAKALDDREDTFIVLAHDMTLQGVVEVFPKTANEWKQKGWKDRTRWSFLSDLAIAAAEGENVV